MVYPWGVEQNLFDHVSSARSKHGLTKQNKFRAWIDCIKEQKLGDGFFMVTWHSWQISKGISLFIYLVRISERLDCERSILS